MTKDDDKWVNQLRKRMDDYAEPLPDNLWKRIEDDMSSPKVIPFWRTRGFAAAASVAVVLVASVTIWLLRSSSTGYIEKENVVAHRLLEEERISNTQSVESQSLAQSVVPSTQPRVRKTLPQSSVLLTSEGIDTSSVPSETDVLPVVTLDTLAVLSEKETPRKKNPSAKERQQADKQIMQRNQQLLAAARKNKKASSWSLGLATGGTPYASSGAVGMDGLLLSNGVVNDMASDIWEDNTLAGKNYVNQTDEAEAHHRMPISVGASIKIDWNERWAFETGLYYTYLASELETVTGKRCKVNQKLHYLGVPLKVHRQLWSNSWFSVYASAGVMLEKCIKGTQDISETYTAYSSLTQSGVLLGVTSGIPTGGAMNAAGLTSQFTSNETPIWVGAPASKTEHVDVETRPWQFSIQGAVGAQAKLGKGFGIYVEPGVAYYTDDRSSLYTIRKDHPLNFNLQVGVRYHFAK